MDKQARFESLARRARLMQDIGERAEYWAGYARGIRRAYHGEAFETDEAHELWLSLADQPDVTSRERGAGYRDGLAAMDGGSISLPTAAAVHAYLRAHGITGARAARMMYLSDSRQVRKYTGGENPRQMDGARWFALHAHMMLPPETIAEIESAMEADSDAKP